MALSMESLAAGLSALSAARAATDEIFQLAQPGCLYDRPIPERHRLIFYVGHVEAFDWNLIARREFDVAPFHADFDRLFAFGIDPGPNGLPTDKHSDWPEHTVVLDYVERCRRRIDELWEDTPEQLRWVALEHRLMHAETLAYMLHNFPLAKLVRPHGYSPETDAGEVEAASVEIPAGSATLGLSRDGGFGWDNEYDQHTVDIPAFSIGKYKVTNGEYLDFVRTGAPAPHFWVRRGGEWLLRCMFAEIPLPMDWPVYVTHEQALAYATWLGRRLPTEPEWHRASAASTAGKGNFGMRRWDPEPVTASQLTGNGWEWTSTIFGPFPGFRPFAFYPGYSADFFDGAHYVLKGASPRTAPTFLRPSFRNWFRPDYPYVFATFRCVEQGR
jgi:iron(II)-dependent oxidoreductase